MSVLDMLARTCICVPTTSQLALLNSPGGGALWQRLQFSAHNCAPDLDAEFLETKHPLIDIRVVVQITIRNIAKSDFFIMIIFKLKNRILPEHI
jgi:hypothetical protein